MTPTERHAIAEAISALDFAADIADIGGGPEYAKSYRHAAESLRLAFHAPNSTSNEEFVRRRRNYGTVTIPLAPLHPEVESP